MPAAWDCGMPSGNNASPVAAALPSDESELHLADIPVCRAGKNACPTSKGVGQTFLCPTGGAEFLRERVFRSARPTVRRGRLFYAILSTEPAFPGVSAPTIARRWLDLPRPGFRRASTCPPNEVDRESPLH